ncbi:ArsR/SmtB family transcription factor [Psychrobacter sp. FDAARGOS_221]|uniref:ArsR/SmtB family transcription factor n=1 Tax=Psychrobacter sp. FDAARGOS_221 TaxID=1975705 RepID=UPI000BB54F5D|nr:metalloregulator ArsR/SmtB family transcription factor [Psychrobacter sp. FDAARGOS_221]PNK61618.1 ArsR family transcriptional regulator [Psychrobacter sp. FDAARGOS_221]
MLNNINEIESVDFEALKTSASKASALLKSLSHPDRLLLLCQLVQGESCVRDLEVTTGIRQPSLSQQLGVLRESELVSTRREGRQIFYSIASDDALSVMRVLYQLYCAPQQSEDKNKQSQSQVS